MSSNATTNDRPRLDPGGATLLASAFVLFALVIVQASRLGGAPAMADVSEVGDLTVLTAAARVDDDIVLILDRREEALYVYGVQARRVLLYDTQRLDRLFQAARGAGGGRSR